MQSGVDYLFFDKVAMMSGPNTLKQVEAVMIGTKNYVFLIPQKTTTQYIIVTTFKNHKYFADTPVKEGCLKLLSELNSVEEIEKAFINLLEDDEKYVHNLNNKEFVKINKLFRTYTFRFAISKLRWTAAIIKGHEWGKATKEFYSQYLKK